MKKIKHEKQSSSRNIFFIGLIYLSIRTHLLNVLIRIHQGRVPKNCLHHGTVRNESHHFLLLICYDYELRYFLLNLQVLQSFLHSKWGLFGQADHYVKDHPDESDLVLVRLHPLCSNWRIHNFPMPV